LLVIVCVKERNVIINSFLPVALAADPDILKRIKKKRLAKNFKQIILTKGKN